RGKATFSRAVVRASRLNCWKTNPNREFRKTERTSGTRSWTGIPSIRNSPSVGTSRHPKMLIVVDLPEPDAPVMATTSPAATSRTIPARARTVASPLPYVFVTARIDRSAGSCAGSSMRETIGAPPFRGELRQHALAGVEDAGSHFGDLPVGHARPNDDPSKLRPVAQPDAGLVLGCVARRSESKGGARDAKHVLRGRRTDTNRGRHAGLEQEIGVVDGDDRLVRHDVLHDDRRVAD